MSPDEFKKIREKLNLTQDELAETFGFAGRNAITHYEMGFRKPSVIVAALMRLLETLSERKAEEFIDTLNSFVAIEKKSNRSKPK